ncbi:MAG: EF-hand domain-containing protein [Reyranellaceae bacterium]
MMLAAAALPLLHLPAFGQQPSEARRPAQPPPWFTEIDTAKTGVVTREQFIAHRMKTFDQLDADKDGVLSRVEFIKLAEPPFAPPPPDPATLLRRRALYDQEFGSIDTNDDGKVSRAEFQTSAGLAFRESDIDGDGRATREEVMLLERIAENAREKARDDRCRVNPDCNGDGVIDLEEFVAFETARIMERLDFDKDRKITLQTFLTLAGPTTNLPGQPTYQQRRAEVIRRFQEIDANKTGVIGDADFRAWATAAFKRIDLDGDGKINLSEWRIASQSPQPAPPAPPPAATAKPPAAPAPAKPAATASPARPVRSPPPPPPPPPPPQGLKPGVPLK